MQSRGLPFCFRIAFVLWLGLIGSGALEAGTPEFTLTAADTTVSLGGTGSSTFTLTSLNGYTGTVVIVCHPTSPPADSKLPYCGGGLLLMEQLVGGETVKGFLPLTGLPVPIPASMPHPRRHGSGAGLVLGGAMLLGLAGSRRKRRWLLHAMFAAVALGALAGVCGCAGTWNPLTPGTFPYTIVGTDYATHMSVSGSFLVTVP